MAVWTVRVVDDEDPAAVTSTRFADVEASHPHAPYIERFAELGITAGCGDGSRFCPQDTVTRAHMAIFLSRAFSLAEGPDPGFADVAADAWYAPSVASLAASGVTAGCGDGSRFCPQNTVLRAHMAVFLARALGLLETPDGGGGGGAGSGGGGGGSGGGGGGPTSGGPTSGGPTSGDGTANASDGFTSISAGDKHACRVLADKSLECWGDNLERQLNAPHGEFLAVSAGGFHTCAVRADNTVSCWGESKDGQTRRPRIEFMALSSGFMHTCGVTASEDDAGLVECWGLDSNGQSTPLAGPFRMVSAGYEHTCGLRPGGTVQCWGGNGHGQAGVENPTGPMTCGITCRRDYYPIAGSFTDVSAGTTHTCAVRTDRSLHCWGETRHGESMPPAGEFVAVSAGYRHSCALAVDNTVGCWGRDEYGETAAPGGAFLAVSAGSSFSCGVRFDRTVECWGYSGDARTTPPTD